MDSGVRRSLVTMHHKLPDKSPTRCKTIWCNSDWLPTTAGASQGTKLGPVLFLVMVNLNATSPESCIWKYVDYVSLSEGLVRNSNSTIQSILDAIALWSSSNWMKLNAKRCKEMQICFLKEIAEPIRWRIDDHALELVTSHKVLGPVIQNNLNWNKLIDVIVTKASKRLHIIRVFSRWSVKVDDVVTLNVALISSVLEYCCVEWHHALPAYLSKDWGWTYTETGSQNQEEPSNFNLGRWVLSWHPHETA